MHNGNQERKVVSKLTRSPTEFGCDTELWTGPRIAWLIQERLGVVFHPK